MGNPEFIKFLLKTFFPPKFPLPPWISLGVKYHIYLSKLFSQIKSLEEWNGLPIRLATTDLNFIWFPFTSGRSTGKNKPSNHHSFIYNVKIYQILPTQYVPWFSSPFVLRPLGPPQMFRDPPWTPLRLAHGRLKWFWGSKLFWYAQSFRPS